MFTDPDVLYELCPACEGEADGCIVCWDEGLIEHICDAANQ